MTDPSARQGPSGEMIRPFDLATRRFTEVTPPWLEGALPYAVIVDGFCSRSDDHAIRQYSPAALGRPAVAFSYVAPGQPYLPRDTHQDLHVSARKLVHYLPSSPAFQVTPIGLSLGAVISILAVAEWIHLRVVEPTEILACIPSIIVVAPGFSPAPVIGTEYAQAHPGNLAAIPLPVRQLCSSGHLEFLRMTKALHDAFETINSAGIPIQGGYWIHDTVTPPSWQQGFGNGLYPVINVGDWTAIPGDTVYRQPAPQNRAVRQHSQFYLHSQVVQKVKTLLP